MHCTSKGTFFLTDIIGCDCLKVYLKIYTPQNEILDTPLDVINTVNYLFCWGKMW